jgi:hypothetical protein
MSHGPFVIVDQGILDGDPAIAISYLEPEAEWDSGFAVWSVPPEKAADIDSELLCINCLLGDYPEAGRGMDLARQQGEAICDGRVWVSRRKRHLGQRSRVPLASRAGAGVDLSLPQGQTGGGWDKSAAPSNTGG